MANNTPVLEAPLAYPAAPQLKERSVFESSLASLGDSKPLLGLMLSPFIETNQERKDKVVQFETKTQEVSNKNRQSREVLEYQDAQMRYQNTLSESLKAKYTDFQNSAFTQIRGLTPDLDDMQVKDFMASPSSQNYLQSQYAGILYRDKDRSPTDNAMYQKFLSSSGLAIEDKDGKQELVSNTGKRIPLTEENYVKGSEALKKEAMEQFASYTNINKASNSQNVIDYGKASFKKNIIAPLGGNYKQANEIVDQSFNTANSLQKKIFLLRSTYNNSQEDGAISPVEKGQLMGQLEAVSGTMGLQKQVTSNGEILVRFAPNGIGEEPKWESLKSFSEGYLKDNDVVANKIMMAVDPIQKAIEEKRSGKDILYNILSGNKAKQQSQAGAQGTTGIAPSPEMLQLTEKTLAGNPLNKGIAKAAEASGQPGEYKNALAMSIQKASEVLKSLGDNPDSKGLKKVSDIFTEAMSRSGVSKNQIPPIFEVPALNAEIQEAQAMPDKSKLQKSTPSMSIGAQGAVEELRNSKGGAIEAAQASLAAVLKQWGAGND